MRNLATRWLPTTGRRAARTEDPPSDQAITSELSTLDITGQQRCQKVVAHCQLGVTGRSAASLWVAHPVTGAPGDLSCRRRCAVDDLGDVGVVQIEHIAQHQRGAFEWVETLEGHQQCERDPLGFDDLVAGVSAGDDRFGEPRPGVGLPSTTG